MSRAEIESLRRAVEAARKLTERRQITEPPTTEEQAQAEEEARHARTTANR